jgi:protocatechuate 3,4-dioxygenase beta subunit
MLGITIMDITNVKRIMLTGLTGLTVLKAVTATILALAVIFCSISALAQTSQTSQTSQTDSAKRKFSPEKVFKDGEAAAQSQEKMGMRGVIQGRILFENGKPAVGVAVSARFKRHQSGMPGEGFTVTDSKGRYRLHGLNPYYRDNVPQEFWIELYCGDQPYLPEIGRIVSLGNMRHHTAINVDFKLCRAPVITVRARDSRTGKPFNGLQVTAAPSVSNGSIVEGITDGKGEFHYIVREFSSTIELENLYSRATPMRYSPSTRGYYEVAFTGVEDLHDVTIDVEIDTDIPPEPKAIGVYHGVVKDSEGMPVVGADVRLFYQSETVTGVSDSAGGFAFVVTEKLKDGAEIRIEAEKDGKKATHTFHVGEKQSKLELRLQKP